MTDPVRILCKDYRVKPGTVAAWQKSATETAFAALCAGVIAASTPGAKGVSFGLKDAAAAAAEEGAFDDLIEIRCDADGEIKRQIRILPKTVLQVYNALADRTDAGGITYVSIRWIRWRTKLTEGTIRRALRVLLAEDRIGRFERWPEVAREHQGPGWSAAYRSTITVLLPWPELGEPPSPVETAPPSGAAPPAPASGSIDPAPATTSAPPITPVKPAPVAPTPRPRPPPQHAEATLRELRAHPDLAPIATPEDAIEIAKAADVAGVALELIVIALKQHAAKVATRSAQPTRVAAVSFVTRMLTSPASDPRASGRRATAEGDEPLTEDRVEVSRAELEARLEASRAAEQRADAERAKRVEEELASGRFQGLAPTAFAVPRGMRAAPATAPAEPGAQQLDPDQALSGEGRARAPPKGRG